MYRNIKKQMFLLKQTNVQRADTLRPRAFGVTVAVVQHLKVD